MTDSDKIVYVDKLCLKFIIRLLANKNMKKVRYLQKRRFSGLDILYVWFLSRISVSVKFEPVDKAGRYYRTVFNSVDNFIASLPDEVDLKISPNFAFLFRQTVSQYRFEKVWRLFVFLHYLNKSNGVPVTLYCGVGLNRKLIDKVSNYAAQEFKYVNSSIYKSFATADEANLLYENRAGVARQFIGLFSVTLRLLMPPRVSLKKQLNVDILFFSHKAEIFNDTFNPPNLLKGLNKNILLINPAQELMSIKDKRKIGHLFINPSSLLNYYRLVFMHLAAIIRAVSDVGELHKVTNIIYGYCFMTNIIRDCNIKLVFSFYESWLGQSMCAAAKESKAAISLTSVWSLGYFPSQSIATFNKNSDRYFIWGKWHHYIMKKSKDSACGYVNIGYPGLDLEGSFLQSAETLRSTLLKKYSKVIAYYDTTTADDLFFSAENSLTVFKKLVNLAVTSNSILIFKTKKKILNEISRVIERNPDHVIVDNKQSNLTPAFAADVVFGVLNSTLPAIAAAYGKKTYFLNFGDVVDEKWMSIVGEVGVFIAVDEIDAALLQRNDTNERVTVSNASAIDHFCDGKCHQRVSEYIEYLFHENNGHMCKNDKLRAADARYNKKYSNAVLS